MIKLFGKMLSLIGFLILLLVLWRGLNYNPSNLPSALINKPAPKFTLTILQSPNQVFNQNDLTGHISLVNVWASWCGACRYEHPILMDLNSSQQVVIYGIDYKDDRAKANAWIKQYGDPYRKVGFDPSGITSINWGVYGTPETFLLDAKGIIRYRHVGPLTHLVWQQEFVPQIKRLHQLSNGRS